MSLLLVCVGITGGAQERNGLSFTNSDLAFNGNHVYVGNSCGDDERLRCQDAMNPFLRALRSRRLLLGELHT
jgi:hypothetical protein